MGMPVGLKNGAMTQRQIRNEIISGVFLPQRKAVRKNLTLRQTTTSKMADRESKSKYHPDLAKPKPG